MPIKKTKAKRPSKTKAAKAPARRPAKKTSPSKLRSSEAPDPETRRLEAIVRVFGRSDLAELEYEDQDISLKLSRYTTSMAAMATPPASPSASAARTAPDVGHRVSKGQTLCIIEAMKLMNEIPADVDGRVVAVLVSNGEPVQFGDPLFEIAVS